MINSAGGSITYFLLPDHFACFARWFTDFLVFYWCFYQFSNGFYAFFMDLHRIFIVLLVFHGLRDHWSLAYQGALLPDALPRLKAATAAAEGPEGPQGPKVPASRLRCGLGGVVEIFGKNNFSSWDVVFGCRSKVFFFESWGLGLDQGDALVGEVAISSQILTLVVALKDSSCFVNI